MERKLNMNSDWLTDWLIGSSVSKYKQNIDWSFELILGK